MLEHMIFKRSKHLSTEDILKTATSMGGNFNAATDKDVTYYYFKTTTAKYKTAINIISEILTSPLFLEKDLAVEKNVVLEELSKGLDEDERLLWNLSMVSVLPFDHPYSRLVIGTPETVKGLSAGDLQAYFDDRYKDYVVIINCTERIKTDVKERVEKAFAGHLFGHNKTPCNIIPREIERKAIVLQKPTNQNNIVLTFPYYGNYGNYGKLDTKQVLLFEFISFVLSGARLYSLLTYELRGRRGLVYNISSFNENMKHFTTFKIALSSTTDDVILLLDAIYKVITKVQTRGIKSLGFFKQSFENSFKLNMTSDDYRVLVVGTQIFNTEEADTFDVKRAYDIIKGITNDDIMKTCRDLFVWGNMGLVCVGNFADPQASSAAFLEYLEKRS